MTALSKPKRILANALVGTLIASFAMPSAAVLANHSSFDPNELERAITDYYGFFPSDAPPAVPGMPAAPMPAPSASPRPGDDLSDVDRGELADAIADEVKILSPSSFNDVVVHLATDYRQQPEHREAIEMLMADLHDKVADELRQNAQSHPLLHVLDDVFYAFTAAYVFGFGKNLWESRGSGLKNVERFRDAIRAASANVRNYRLALIGIGTAVGLSQALYEYLETKKLDPKDILNQTQGAVVTDIATIAAQRRDEMRALADQAPDQLRPNLQADRQRIAQVEPELTRVLRQADHLMDSAPQYHGREQLVKDDVQTARMAINQLSAKLDQAELGGNAPN